MRFFVVNRNNEFYSLQISSKVQLILFYPSQVRTLVIYLKRTQLPAGFTRWLAANQCSTHYDQLITACWPLIRNKFSLLLYGIIDNSVNDIKHVQTVTIHVNNIYILIRNIFATHSNYSNRHQP